MAEEQAAGPLTFAGILAAGKPAVARTRICMRGDLTDEINRLTIALAAAKEHDEQTNEPAQAPAIAAQIVDLTEQARAAEVEFVFSSIGRKPWRALVAEHPPTDELRKNGADFDPETFPAVAMAKSCISPTGATLADFEQLRDGDLLGDTQWTELWLTCRRANTGGAEIPLSEAAFALTRGSGSS